MLFVWGLHLGVAGVALGTALGAWINVGDSDLVGQKPRLAGDRNALSCGPCRRRLLAALATAAGAWLGARLGAAAMPGHYADMAALAGAMICASFGYGAVVLLFRTRLPLGRLAR